MSAFLMPDWRLMSGYVILLLVFVCHIDTTHFRGVRMSWAPYDRSVGTEIQIRFTVIWWRGADSSAATYCDATGIATGKILNPVGYNVYCQVGCSDIISLSPSSTTCVDYNATYDWSMGLSIMNFSVPLPTRYFAFTWIGRGWAATKFQGVDNPWQVVMKMNVTPRADTGLVNRSPYSTLIAQPVLPSGFNYTVCLPVFDDDGDNIRCRWALRNGTIDECGTMCLPPLNVVLHDDCSMTINSAIALGYYVAPIQVEDFAKGDPFTALSSVPLQFYFQVANMQVVDPSLTNSRATVDCRISPTLVAPFPTCVSVGFGTAVNVTTAARMGTISVGLANVIFNTTQTVLQPTVNRTGVFDYQATSVITATTSSVTSEVVCYYALDNTGMQSDTRCFLLVLNPPQPSALNITFLSLGSTATINITFDQQIRQPSSSKIHVYNANNNPLPSNAVTSVTIVNNDTLVITVVMSRVPPGTYHVLLDAGAVNSFAACGGDSLPISDSDQLPFTVASPSTAVTTVVTTAVTTVVTTASSMTTAGNVTTAPETTQPVTNVTSSFPLSNVTTGPQFSLNPGASTFESSDINALYLVLICLGVAFAIALGLLITVAIKKHLDRRNGLYFSSI